MVYNYSRAIIAEGVVNLESSSLLLLLLFVEFKGLNRFLNNSNLFFYVYKYFFK